MSGRDTIGIAETGMGLYIFGFLKLILLKKGSGKTMAFVLPMLRHVAD